MGSCTSTCFPKMTSVTKLAIRNARLVETTQDVLPFSGKTPKP